MMYYGWRRGNTHPTAAAIEDADAMVNYFDGFWPLVLL